jgi:hypothetical protein
MASTYTTKEGDRWDRIALAVYGSEMHSDWLMKNNIQHIGTYALSAGIVLNTPDLPEETETSLPPWR